LAPAVNSALSFLTPFILVAVPTVIGWLVPKLGKLLHVKIDAAVADQLDRGIEHAIAFGVQHTSKDIAAHGLTVDVKNATIAAAIRYAFATIPAVLAHFGITSPEQLVDRVLARFDRHPAVVAGTPLSVPLGRQAAPAAS
jgi:hypothetical protein